MRNGSITLGLLIGLTIGAGIGGLAVGGGAGWWLTGKSRDAKALETAHAHQVEQDALQARVEALGADLATCEAKVTAESLTAALAPDLAEVGARAALVSSLPRLETTRALLEVASPRLLAAESRMLGCEAVGATGDSARLGCGPQGAVVTEWQAAVQAQAACPEPSVSQASE